MSQTLRMRETTTDEAPAPQAARDAEALATLSATQRGVLCLSVLVVALCGIVYELVIAATSSYLLGNSVYQFSLTIGLFMFAMGLGSLITSRFGSRLIERFILVELLISLVGGLSAVALFTVFPYGGLYRPTMYTLTIVVGALVGIEIPILTRVLSEVGGLRRSIAHVLALDYFGALVGSVAFPLLLLPFLGLFRAGFVIGLLNAGVAALNVFIFARILGRPGWWSTGVGGVLALLGVGLAVSPQIMQFAESRLYGDPIVFSEQTPYQKIVVTRDPLNGNHRLYLDGHLQFAQSDEYRYHEALVHPLMSLPTPVEGRPRVLILGGGDGMAAREVLKHDIASIDLVDLDPVMTELCSRFGPIVELNGDALEHPKVTIHNEDAFSFLRACGSNGRRFDRVIVDLPDPHNEALSKLYSTQFYTLLRDALADGGAFVTQSASPQATRRAYWSIADTIASAEMVTHSYRIDLPSFGVWGFHIGAREPVWRQMSQPLPVTTRYLRPDFWSQPPTFALDESREGVADELIVNSLFEPQLYLLYQREVTR